jgi:hypothetical protein
MFGDVAACCIDAAGETSSANDPGPVDPELACALFRGLALAVAGCVAGCGHGSTDGDDLFAS